MLSAATVQGVLACCATHVLVCKFVWLRICSCDKSVREPGGLCVYVRACVV